MSTPVYLALCLVVPAAWGAIAYLVFGAIDRRRRAHDHRPPPMDYSI